MASISLSRPAPPSPSSGRTAREKPRWRSCCAGCMTRSRAGSKSTRKATTILISHRFSTVRQADRICVLEHGKVIELGTHAELMAKGGRYKTMFDLQAQRFGENENEEGRVYDVLA